MSAASGRGGGGGEGDGGGTFGGDLNLEALPVPSLEETMSELLVQVLSHAESSEEYASLAGLVAASLHPGSDVRLAQEMLEQRARWSRSEDGKRAGTHRSWLLGWWSRDSYLGFRDAVPVNVAYFLQMAPSPIPHVSQTQRAATMVACTLALRDSLVHGSLPRDKAGKGRTIDMSGYRLLFHQCRVPKAEVDAVRGLWWDLVHQSGVGVEGGGEVDVDVHLEGVGGVLEGSDLWNAPDILVLHGGRVWLVKVKRGGSGDGWSGGVGDLERVFAEIVRMGGDGVGLGAITSMDRASCFSASVLAREEVGERAWRRIEEAAFVLCLDSRSVGNGGGEGEEEKERKKKKRFGDVLLHGCAPEKGWSDRWWDKLQLVVSGDEEVGWIGEHSRVDGSVGAKMATHVAMMEQKGVGRSGGGGGGGGGGVEVEEVGWGSGGELGEWLSKAEGMASRMAVLEDSAVAVISEVGRADVKRAGVSPDAFAQVAIQLAYQLCSTPTSTTLPPHPLPLPATYEPAQTRRFHGGRTETIRAASLPLRRFFSALFSSAPPPLLPSLLRMATAEHSRKSSRASRGLGVDRHLFGLHNATLPTPSSHPTLHKLLSHPLHTRAATWKISTSNLSAPPIVNWGFGQVCPQGVGVAYSVLDSGFQFFLSSRKDTPPPTAPHSTTTSTPRDAAGFTSCTHVATTAPTTQSIAIAFAKALPVAFKHLTRILNIHTHPKPRL